MGQSASFPFEIGAEPDRGYANRHRGAYWQLYSGKRKVDGAEVSIFKLDKQATPRLQLEAGAHGLQRMKSVRHPYILQYLEGADFEKELVLVTEPVVPLLEWLGGLGPAHREQQVAWGLRCLASALQFLNTNNSMTHGMVCAQNVFVTRGGDWKLGGLDLLCEWRQGGKDTLHFQLHEALTPMEYRAPERRNNNMDLMLQAAPGAMDVWALGVLLGEIVQLTEGKPLTSGPLASIQRRCLNDNPPDRPSAAKILQHPLLKPPLRPERGKELLYVLPFLETFSLQDDAAKVQFFQHLAGPLLAALPPEVGLHKILPTFRDYVHIGPPSASAAAGGAAASSGPPTAGGASADALLQQPGRRQLVLAALPACLEILKGMGPEVFAREGEPLVVSLFGLQDRALRATLLQSLSGLADKLSTDAVNGRLLEAILAGFNDSAPQLRELTLKSMLCLSPRLTDRNLTDRLMQRLGKLQGDPEPSIRTNTTIFLGRVAPQLKDGARTRILLPAFLKACRDPFPHARLAGLKAAAACSAYFDPPSVATKLLPTVCCLLIDPDGGVRDAAFQCQDACLKLLTVHAQRLKEEEDRRRSEMAAKGGGAGGADGLASSGSGGAGGMLASATSSVAAWGGSLLFSSVGGGSSSGGPGAPPPPPAHPGGKPPVDLISGSGSGSGSRPVLGGSRLSATAAADDDDDFFDAMGAGGGSGHRRTPSVSSAADALDGNGGGGGGEWGDEMGWDPEESSSKPATLGSLRSATAQPGSGRVGSLGMSAKSQPSAAPPSASLGAMRLSASSAAKLVKPVTDDDLLSMLGDTGPSTASRVAHASAPPPAFSSSPSMDGSSSTSSSASSVAAAAAAGGAAAAGPPKRLGSGSGSGSGRPSRLQAKRLDAAKAGSEWDDF